MDFQQRLNMLIDSETKELYDSPPKHSIEEQQLYFALNDDKRVLSSISNRSIKRFFIALLCCYKSKPVSSCSITLNGRYKFCFEQELADTAQMMWTLTLMNKS